MYSEGIAMDVEISGAHVSTSYRDEKEFTKNFVVFWTRVVGLIYGGVIRIATEAP